MRVRTPAIFLLALATTWIGSSGCSVGSDADPPATVPTISGGAGGSGGGGGGGQAADEALDDFFSLTQIHTIEVTLSSEALDALKQEPKQYTHASVTIDGAAFADVGMRLKGGAGSFVPIGSDYPEVSGDGNGKPGKSAFIVDFDRYQKGVDFHGLEKLTVNNQVQDPSHIHEYLGYALFREGGVPASRTGFAQVSWNGETKGLYALIETPDNDSFLKKHYGTSKGNLYEGEYGCDLTAETYAEYDQDHGKDKSKQDLKALATALDAIGEGQDPLPVLEQYFDLDEYLTFAATEIFLGHWDGYAQSSNNYNIHHSPADDKWTFLPWGIDQLFENQMGKYAGVMMQPGPSWGDQGGRVHQLCLSSVQCRKRLGQAFADVLERVDEMDLEGLAVQARQAVEQLALAESTAHGDPKKTTESYEQVTEYLEMRRDEIEAWLPCLVGQAIDDDGDGFDVCTVDCNDHDPDVHPGANEICNFQDDNCNGSLDELPECPKCKTEKGPGGVELSFCFEPRTWTAAQQYCQEQGLELASLHDDEIWEFSSFGAMDFIGVEETWIGLNDRQQEGSFTWTDGTALDYDNWCPEHPMDWGEEEDCVVNAPFGWRDVACDDQHAFICHAP